MADNVKKEKHGDHTDYVCVPCGGMRFHSEKEAMEHQKKAHKM